MAVGLLCGSVLGATFGFIAGLFVDMALLQTLGLSSLVYITCGYGAGRLRELRDPQAGATPLVVGALATAVATIGFSLMNFLLGVDAPVSFLLLRQIITTIVVNTLSRCRCSRSCGAGCSRAARRSAPSPAPRLHDRRPVALSRA